MPELTTSTNTPNATVATPEEQKELDSTIPSFAGLQTFVEYVREHGIAPPFVDILGTVFTMDNYDEAGRRIDYGNIRTGKALLLMTQDRYNNGFDDAHIHLTEIVSYRSDITYYE